MKTKRWHLTSIRVDEFVNAKDQFEAWDSLRERPATDFGLIVAALVSNETLDDGCYLIRTSILMFRWGRDSDADRFVALAIERGFPNSSNEDRLAAIRIVDKDVEKNGPPLP